ncbi:hypothetical protein [Nodularia chucula]|uniref:hypothetical protein n=1 Tax=Nodularia chucula TaxID=3093667 RepID=UPI0039C65AA7
MSTLIYNLRLNTLPGSYVIDIPNSQLNLPNGDVVSQENPTAGITDMFYLGN